MRRCEFIRSVVEVCRRQGEEVWEKAKAVKDRASMAVFERACAGLGMEVGREAFAKGVEAIEARRRRTRCADCGCVMERSVRSRTYYTLVGQVSVSRWYYYCRRCGVGLAPLDEWIEGEGSQVSLGVEEKICQLASEMGYERAGKKLKALCGLEVSSTTVARHATRWGQHACRRPMKGCEWSGSVDLSIDAAKVNTIDGGWRDMKIAVFEEPGGAGRRYSVHIGHHERWGRALRRTAGALGVRHTSQMRIWGDGADWIWKVAQVNFPGARCIVDYYHVMENLSEYGRQIYGEGSAELSTWLHSIGHTLKDDGGRAVHDEIRAGRPGPRRHWQVWTKVLKYLKARLDKMDYPAYRLEGLDIGSGVVESACKQVIESRLKGGRRWLRDNVLSMAAMRSLFLAEQWDSFWQTQLQCA